ncbi:phospholipase [Microbacterium sp. G2-8]|uniref:aggregation-promoting factor C-terminal-like domain-containing protein n=1 Tax=Microbacterium sp. G2-8 TaxID=2842454 RepID=UPI0021AA8ACC|nr:phospholipase [Microbacterium sp. G2-8]
MTSDETPQLTPFPRPGYVIEMRQKRDKRRRLVSIGSALALGVVAVGSGAAAATVEDLPARDSAQVQLASGETAESAAATLDDAKNLLKRAKDKVDTTELTGYVDYLEDYEAMPAAVATGVTADAGKEIDELTVEVTEYEQEQERIAAEKRKKAEEAAAAAAKKAAEKAAEEQAAEEAAAAEALAQVNTVDGAKATARDMAATTYGWGEGEFSCLDSLWTKESGWNYQAQNPSSGAYGIPQSLPGDKMSSIAGDWATNAHTQIAWGLDYISSVYGTPCAAWGHSQATDWY